MKVVAAVLCLAVSVSARMAYVLSDGADEFLKGRSLVTTFTCADRAYGYYADMENECSIFHVCQPIIDAAGMLLETAHFTFLCGEETVFSQDSLTCSKPEDAYPCQDSSSLYDVTNEQFGIIDRASILDAALNAAVSAVDVATEIVDGATDITASSVDTAADVVASVMDGAADAAASIADGAAEIVNDAGDIAASVVDGAADAAVSVVDVAAETVDGTIDVTANIVDTAVDAAASVVDGAANVVDDVVDAAANAIVFPF